ncbi:MAG TPA: FHA domain-containing protein [Pirellulales bacterium]|nr:FHA domain-containing protein [Pirellulales bacterium]
MRPKLVLVAGKADKAEIRLKLPTIVGRTHDAGLMIAHKTVSRRHCELFERHGMLFVRDTGSRNGTLVDSAPIKKEAMVKPGHTLTIGPLTFRADYEPADSFMSSDEPAPAANGAATDAGIATAATAMVNTAEEATRDIGAAEEGAPATITQTAKPSDTPGELEFEEFSVSDLAELDMPAEIGSDESAEEAIADEAPAPAQAASVAPAAAADEEVSFDDDLSVEFDLNDLGEADLADGNLGAAPAEPASAAKEPNGPAPAVAAADSDDAVADFDLSDDSLSGDSLSEGSAPAAKKSADSLDDLLDDDLGFDLKDLGEPAAAGTESGEAGDDLGFTLEDLEESPAEAAPEAAPAAEAADEDAMTFDLAESEVTAEGPDEPAKDAGSKLKLGEEKGPAGDSEMSRFMKELGL